MDLSTLKELGVPGISIGAMFYLSYKLVQELREARIDYRSFVKDNNHTTTELVREATATMVEVKHTITTHNEIQKRMLDQLEKK